MQIQKQKGTNTSLVKIFGEEFLLEKTEYFSNSRFHPFGYTFEQEIQALDQSIACCNKKKLINLSIIGGGVNDSKIQQIAEYIMKCNQLKILMIDLSWNEAVYQLNSNQLASLIQNLSESLTTIIFNFTNNSLDGFFSETLIQSISLCYSLQNLDISFRGNNLKEGISNGFKNISNLKKLKILNLDLSFNTSIQSAFIPIFEQIVQLESLKEFSLNMRKTYLKLHQVQFFFENIHKFSNLQKFNLNLQENELCQKIYEVIVSNIKALNNLIELNLYLGWTSANSQIFSILFQSLLQLKSLRMLNLEYLWNTLENMQLNQDFNLSYLKIEKINLNLRSSKINSQCVMQILDAIHKIPSIKEISLDLQANPLLGGETQLIGQSISKMKLLALTLNIDESNLNNKDVVDLLTQMSSNQYITRLHLDLRENKFDDNCLESIGSSLANFKKLKILQLKLDKIKESYQFESLKEMFYNLFKSKTINQLFYYQFPIYQKKQLTQSCSKILLKAPRLAILVVE